MISSIVEIFALLSDIMAIYLGLSIAICHKYTNVILYSDCKVAVTLLKCPDININKYTSMLYHCRKLWKQIPGARIDYCSRRLNDTANVMAKACRKEDGTLNVIRSFPNPPSYCIDAYRNDCKTIFNVVM